MSDTRDLAAACGAVRAAASLIIQIRCVRREIALRKRVYPGFVERGKLTPENSAREILTMEAVHATLMDLARLAGIEVPE